MSPCSSPASLTVEQVVAAWFPLFGYPLAKAEAAQICQRVAERLRPSSWGVLGRNECTTVSLYGYPLAKAEAAQICHVGSGEAPPQQRGSARYE